MPCPSHPRWLDHSNYVWLGVQDTTPKWNKKKLKDGHSWGEISILFKSSKQTTYGLIEEQQEQEENEKEDEEEGIFVLSVIRSQDSSVGTATGNGLDNRGTCKGQDITQTGSEAHPASYSVRTGGSFPMGKAAAAWSSSCSAEMKNGGAIPPLPYMSSWRYA
jgi:hypothetical protein